MIVLQTPSPFGRLPLYGESLRMVWGGFFLRLVNWVNTFKEPRPPQSPPHRGTWLRWGYSQTCPLPYGGRSGGGCRGGLGRGWGGLHPSDVAKVVIFSSPSKDLRPVECAIMLQCAIVCNIVSKTLQMSIFLRNFATWNERLSLNYKAFEFT